MVLAPGQDHLHIRPLRLSEPRPVWRIEIPRGVPLLYAGTLALGETTERGIFSTLWLGLDPARTEVRDETAAATALAARDLPGLPPPHTRLMQRHSGPIRLGVPE